MTMPADDEVNVILFEETDHILSYTGHDPSLLIRIMCAFGVRRKMPESNHPFPVLVCCKIFFQPLVLWAKCIEEKIFVLLYPIRIKRDEMNITQVERIKGRIVRRH